MNYGYYVKRSNDNFVIDIVLGVLDSGYNVVPKSVDKWNAYDIADVRMYADANPQMQVVWDEELGKYVTVIDPELVV